MKEFTVKLTASELASLEKLRASKSELTIKELFDKALEEYWSSARYSKSGWRKEVINLFKANISPTFGKKRPSQITGQDVKKWHRGMEERPIAANRSLAVLSRLYAFGIEEGILSPGSNPCSVVARFSEKKRKRYATTEEIHKVGLILEREKEAHPREVAFIFLLMLTGARPRSIERAAPEELKQLEFEGKAYGVLSFQGKTSSDSGEEEVVVIPPLAMELLLSLPKGMRTLTGIKMPRYFWEKVREEAGCPDLWARDWRRTFATVGMSDGVSSGIMGEILNHKHAQTTKRYALLMMNSRMGAVAQISETMEGIIKTG